LRDIAQSALAIAAAMRDVRLVKTTEPTGHPSS
jgi:hypothetical protein